MLPNHNVHNVFTVLLEQIFIVLVAVEGFLTDHLCGFQPYDRCQYKSKYNVLNVSLIKTLLSSFFVLASISSHAVEYGLSVNKLLSCLVAERIVNSS